MCCPLGPRGKQKEKKKRPRSCSPETWNSEGEMNRRTEWKMPALLLLLRFLFFSSVGSRTRRHLHRRLAGARHGFVPLPSFFSSSFISLFLSFSVTWKRIPRKVLATTSDFVFPPRDVVYCSLSTFFFRNLPTDAHPYSAVFENEITSEYIIHSTKERREKRCSVSANLLVDRNPVWHGDPWQKLSRLLPRVSTSRFLWMLII